MLFKTSSTSVRCPGPPADIVAIRQSSARRGAERKKRVTGELHGVNPFQGGGCPLGSYSVLAGFFWTVNLAPRTYSTLWLCSGPQTTQLPLCSSRDRNLQRFPDIGSCIVRDPTMHAPSQAGAEEEAYLPLFSSCHPFYRCQPPNCSDPGVL